MFGTRSTVITLSLCVLLVFLSGPLLHSIIPHGHSDDHGAGPAAMWSDLHGSLRHEDKQLVATVEIMLATFIALLAFVRIVAVRALPRTAIALVRARDESLHSGREQYRRFG